MINKTIPLYQIDAFTSRVFSGNPAAVCPLDDWLPDAILQSVAAENNLSETAFFAREGNGYRIRWFTPVCEVNLCGHATLASAFVIFTQIDTNLNRVVFASRSGELAVERAGDRMVMDFPSDTPVPCAAPPALSEALGIEPVETLAAADYMAVLPSEADVRRIAPDLHAMKALDRRGVIVTARGEDCDFVSRFFAPNYGIDEDPVTGSAHCELAPYWAGKLGKDELQARQVSRRGGELVCSVRGNRTLISGNAVLFLAGAITI
ncbi:MAG: PhzF family phenazine biosynthesis protein [Nitrospirae bacterium]|nr:PhzF family phenazine biosynthesis protein [Nitrospirota bacterium]